MFDPVKVAWGEYLQRFFAQVVPTNKQLELFTKSTFGEVVWLAPGRMIDDAEEMLAKYRKKDVRGKATNSYRAPVMISAFARDYTPTGRDYTRQIADMEYITFPEDPKERVFGLKLISGDLRVQTCIFAQEEPTARSLAAQFCLYIDSVEGRRFKARYPFAGFDSEWPVQLDSPDTAGVLVQTGEKNMTILAIDLNLHCAVPLFYAPKTAEEADNKGSLGDAADPAGFRTVQTINYPLRCHRAANPGDNLGL